MKQDDYKPGDLIVFIQGHEKWAETPREFGWIVRRDLEDPNNPAVLMGFPGLTSEYHYFDLELREWEKAGTIEVSRG